MINKKRYSSVTELNRAMVDDKDFSADLEQHLAARQIAKKLFVLRNSLGLSQKDIADKMTCSQRRVARLENGKDADVRLGDLIAYLQALGMDATILVHKQNQSAVEQMKYHASCINRLSDGLADSSKPSHIVFGESDQDAGPTTPASADTSKNTANKTRTRQGRAG